MKLLKPTEIILVTVTVSPWVFSKTLEYILGQARIPYEYCVSTFSGIVSQVRIGKAYARHWFGLTR